MTRSEVWEASKRKTIQQQKKLDTLRLEKKNEGNSEHQRRNSFSFYERVKNLSDIVITKTEEVLLSKGLKHCVGENISLKHLEKLAACTDAVLGGDNETKLICKRKLKRYFTSKRDVQKMEQTQVKKLEKKLKETDTLAVKADKGNTTVLIKKNEYITKVTEFLNSNDFEKMKKDPTQKFQKKVREIVSSSNAIVKDMLRRGSMVGPGGEPLIVVEESGGIQEEEEEEESGGGQQSGPESPSHNPYLLSPYRDMRKRSLPTPQCTSGITASQVRRLSEQGGEGGKGPSAREAAFLATLSTAPAPTPGGRRHSVVTISRAPPTSLVFGRNRRESIAAFGPGAPRGFPRKDSTPSLAGSSFNLQLDIMDDIAEIKAARKVKMKVWQTEAEQKVCEISEGGSVARYHQKESRRFSDVTGIAPLKDQACRRASEVPPPAASTSQQKPSMGQSGIVCSNSDLITLMGSSAQEIPQDVPVAQQTPTATEPKPLSAVDDKRIKLKDSRSNSFDVSLLPDETGQKSSGNWFLKRHLPTSKKSLDKDPPEASTSKPLDRKSGSLKTPAEQEKEKQKDKVIWDKPSGSVVDPHVIGSAIEVFLTKRSSDTPPPSAPEVPKKGPKSSSTSSWFSGEAKETDDEVTCDNSLCSTLKDLFVK